VEEEEEKRKVPGDSEENAQHTRQVTKKTAEKNDREPKPVGRD